MNITNVTDYDNITSSNYSDYGNMTLCNCTINENNIDIIIPAFLFTIPCDLSILCLLSLMVYTSIKLLFNNKGTLRKILIQIILFVVI